MRTLVAQGERQAKVAHAIKADLERSKAIQDNLRMIGMNDILDQVRSTIRDRQLGFLETVEAIRDERLSFARFGDGEFKMMTRLDFNARFQKNSPELQAALRSVLTDAPPSLLLGMPNVFVDLHWTSAWAEMWTSVRPYLNHAGRYGNSHVSRPLMFQTFGQQAVEAWASVWAGKRALIVTGEGSRFDLVDPLFSSLAGSDVLYSKPTNAFSDLGRVVDQVAARDVDVVLISLGPAGTVLASELARTGCQALDIGHLSSSYVHVIEEGAFPESTPLVRPFKSGELSRVH